MDTDVEDGVLVSRAQQGHIDAFEVLVRRYSPIAYRVALRIVVSHHDAQDVAQEALVSAWQSLPQFRSDASFSTWLYKIVTRKALDKVDRDRPSETTETLALLADGSRGPDEHATHTEVAATLSAAISALPPQQRVAVVLHHVEGLSYAEVAEITTSTVPAVRSHLFRARRSLTKTLGQWR